LYREWYDNGQLWIKTNYQNGVRQGLYRVWDKDGKLIGEHNFKS
jgi:antitoxin component YwqK of YwqJK toxin-antitoxin module